MMATTTTTNGECENPSSIINNLNIKYCSSSKASRLKLLEIIRNKDLRSAFYDFLCIQFCVENLLCWEAIEKFKHRNGTPSEMYSIAEEIYLLFIRDNSRYEINIYGKQKDRLKETLKKTFILPPSNNQSDTFPKRRKKLRFRKLISKSNLSSIFSDPMNLQQHHHHHLHHHHQGQQQQQQQQQQDIHNSNGSVSSISSSGSSNSNSSNNSISSISSSSSSSSSSSFISAHPNQPPSSPSKLNLRLDDRDGNSSDDSFVVIFKNGGSSSVRGSSTTTTASSIGSGVGISNSESGVIDNTNDYIEDFDRKSIKFGLLKCSNLFNDIQEELEQMMIENSLSEFIKSKTFKEKCAVSISS